MELYDKRNRQSQDHGVGHYVDDGVGDPCGVGVDTVAGDTFVP